MWWDARACSCGPWLAKFPLPLLTKPADAVDVYNAWYDNGDPYSNVATQGTRNPAGDNLCVESCCVARWSSISRA